MKKFMVLVTAAFLISGVAFAHDGGKKRGKGKGCCKKEAKACCKKSSKTTKL